jgi:hypothetical protein
LLERGAANEVVIELDVLAPAEFDRASVPCGDVIGVEAAGDVESYGRGRHRCGELRSILIHPVAEERRTVVGNDGREAGFEMIDEHRAAA